MFQYNYELIEVYDGDTVYINIDLGFHTWLKNQHIRINLIDTPEIRTKNQLEKEAGLSVRNFVQTILKNTEKKVFRSFGIEGKFGRILGDFDVIYNNENIRLAQLLFRKGYGNYYIGGKKKKWSTEQLKNIIKGANNEFLPKTQTEESGRI